VTPVLPGTKLDVCRAAGRAQSLAVRTAVAAGTARPAPVQPPARHSRRYAIFTDAPVFPFARQVRSMKRARDVRDQLVGLMERVEIDMVRHCF